MTLRQELALTTMGKAEYAARYRRGRKQLLTRLDSLPRDVDRKTFLAELDYQMCKRSLFYFLTRHCYTPHSDEQTIALFPSWRYLWYLAKLVQENSTGIISIGKSRQTLGSLFACGRSLWEAGFYPLKNIILHSSELWKVGFGGTKEASSEQCLLGRIEFIYEKLPKHIQERLPYKADKGSERPTATFFHSGEGYAGNPEYVKSRIVGIPDLNTRALNQLSPTGIVNDEVSLQRGAKAFLQSSGALVKGKTWRMDIGTATEVKGMTESRALLRDLLYGAEGEGTVLDEPEFEELVPYNECYTDPELSAILADETDHIVADRMMGRRRKGGNITLLLYFTANPNKGKKHDEQQKNAFDNEAMYRQEQWIDFEVTDETKRLWRLNENGINIGHCQYDPKQDKPYDVLYVLNDMGGRRTALFIQKAQIPNCLGHQVRILAELDCGSMLVPAFCRFLFEYWLKHFGHCPYRFYPDVAERQRSIQTGKGNVDFIREIGRQMFDPNFMVFDRRIGRTEGIALFASKLDEIIGYAPDGKPVPGVLIDPRNCPKLIRALRGMLHQDPRDGSILKNTANKLWEHLGDLTRYYSANEIQQRDIVRPGQLEAAMRPKPPATPLTRRQTINSFLIGQLDAAEQARKDNASGRHRVIDITVGDTR